MILLRPLYFYPICVLLGAALGFGLILTRNIPKTAQSVSSPQTRNTERHNTLKALATVLKQYQNDHHGLPYPLPLTPTEICTTQGPDCGKLVDLSYLVNSNYLESLPNDPIGSRIQYGSGYFISQDGTGGSIHLSAIRAENGDSIMVE